MSEFVVTLLRLGFLVLLWLLVLSAVGVLRRDIFGTRVLARGSVHTRRPGRTPAANAPAPARPAPRDRTVPTRLQLTSGPLNGTTLRLGDAAILLGRAPSSTLVLDDDYSSTRHARIYWSDGGWWVEDLNSTNGTFVNEQRLTAPVPLTTGSQIRIGRTVIEALR